MSAASLCADDCGQLATSPTARYCAICAQRRRRKRPKYAWTEQRLEQLHAAYARGGRSIGSRLAKAWGWPSWVIQRRAAELGLAPPRADWRPWTESEVAQLLEHCGVRTVGWIARKLGRTVASVALKIKREGLRRRISEGYTARELGLCLGVDHKRVERWVADGWLPERRRGLGGDRDGYAWTDADVLRLLVEHPEAYSLAKVSDLWFKELVLSAVRLEERR